MPKIEDIQLNIIKDSRGEDTLEATMSGENVAACSSIPKGKSRGEKEATLVSPEKALLNFEEIKPKILNQPFNSLFDFDNFLIDLDQTKNKQNLGGNLTLVLSQTFARFLSKYKQKELWQILEEEFFILNPALEKTLIFSPPLFFFNLLNGGKHAPYGPYIQEYLIIPQTNNCQKSLSLAIEFLQNLKIYIIQNYSQCNFGDEGGVLIPSTDYEEPLQIFKKIRNEMNSETEISFGLDVAASSFYNKEEKTYHLVPARTLNSEELLKTYLSLNEKYNLFSLEDPFEENDFESFKNLKQKIGERVLIIGDDLTVTNSQILNQASQDDAISGVIIKPTQIGTVTETLQTIGLAHRKGIKPIISHRSAETTDDFIADLAIASRAYGLKAGSPQNPERVVKYRRVINIL
ncbi:MAG TPA: hypothetical protein PK119_01765 [Candidatus Paceibacterota bacterium]|nr:hypothetical protein [Candidatus Paceibacterota bacterium]